MNERLKILKLLEEGKIRAEEAERLLQALNEGESRRRGPHYWSFWKSMETIPEIISTAVAGSFRHGTNTAEEELKFGLKKKIAIEGINGDIEIIGTEAGEITVVKKGIARILDAGPALSIKAINGDLQIKSPRDLDVEFKGVSGDLDLKGINGQIVISSVSGDVKGQELAGSFKGNFVSGDVELDYKAVDQIEIRSRSGDITIQLDPTVQARLEIRTRTGDIDCDLDLRDKTATEGFLAGTLNAPIGRIDIQTDYGDVSIIKNN